MAEPTASPDYFEIKIDLSFLRQNKVSMFVALIVLISLLLAGASKIYQANQAYQARQVGQITPEAASTSRSAEEIKTLLKNQTVKYVVKEGDYVEKILTTVCGETGGKIVTPLRNQDRIEVDQTLEVLCN